MSKHDPLVTLGQIVEVARRAQQMCREHNVSELSADWRNLMVLERLLEIVSEAVKRLPAELRDRYPEVPWRLLAGLRDRIVHGYDLVRHDILHNLCLNDLPVVIEAVGQIIDDLAADA